MSSLSIKNSASKRILLACIVLLIFFALNAIRYGIETPRPRVCTDPRLLITVLTYSRAESLGRLLTSLNSANYGCAQVDLHVHVDLQSFTNSSRCAQVAQRVNWIHGRKTIFQRQKRIGLAQSWFEVPVSEHFEYLAVFEDDMEVSQHYYTFLNMLHRSGSLKSSRVTALCLHPDDWEVHVERPCQDESTYSTVLYTSPEPCNWGPLWKMRQWIEYSAWVTRSKRLGQLPFVPEGISYNYNKYIREGKDVQSSWLWRYNFETSKTQVRYSFSHCAAETEELYFAINHKEPGEHFKKKYNLQNDPSLLDFEFSVVQSRFALSVASFVPFPFSGYETGASSMRG